MMCLFLAIFRSHVPLPTGTKTVSTSFVDDVLIPYERSAKPQLKNAILGQSYRFWDFTISFYSISWLHHPHPLANCMRKAFLHLHFASWASLTALRFLFQRFNCMVGVVWYLPTQLQITVAPSFLQLRNKFWIQFFWRKPGWALTATCSMPFIHSPASAQQTIDLVQRLCLGYLHLG